VFQRGKGGVKLVEVRKTRVVDELLVVLSVGRGALHNVELEERRAQQQVICKYLISVHKWSHMIEANSIR
jgi:hypothetical protein